MNTCKTILLADVTSDETFEVEEVRGRFCNRLMEMGIVPGVNVRFVKSAPFRFPIEIEVNGHHLVLRQEEASGICLKH